MGMTQPNQVSSISSFFKLILQEILLLNSSSLDILSLETGFSKRKNMIDLFLLREEETFHFIFFVPLGELND